MIKLRQALCTLALILGAFEGEYMRIWLHRLGVAMYVGGPLQMFLVVILLVLVAMANPGNPSLHPDWLLDWAIRAIVLLPILGFGGGCLAFKNRPAQIS